MSLNILIVEGNNPKDSEVFIKAAKATCSQNLKNLVLKGNVGLHPVVIHEGCGNTAAMCIWVIPCQIDQILKIFPGDHLRFPF